ncbi:MAG TPA: choice-of-anchor D domain-containing protein [Kofleriaceae bacterium]|nr:choice-of-anchor D domain-containing protein [Kofleriaceae bacterium]
MIGLTCLLLLGALAGPAVAGPAVAINPDPIEFYSGTSGYPGGPPGTKQQTFYSVRNTGDAPLAVSGMAITGPGAAIMAFDDTYDPSCGTGQSCPLSFSLAPGEERWFTVQCTAAQGGTFTASLGVASNATSGTGSATMSCLGLLPPVIQVSAPSLDFGIAHFCDRFDSFCGPFCETRPLTQTLTITNAAPAPSYLELVITPRLSWLDDFIADDACPEDAPCFLGPGESVSIPITFRPYHAYDLSFPLTLTSAYPGQAQVTIPIHAIGGTGRLEFVTPSFLGAVTVGQTLVKTYTVRNAGDSCLSFSGPYIFSETGIELVGSDPAAFTLQAGASQSWTLACTPASTEGASGFADFFLYYQGASLMTQDLYCGGLVAALAITPASLAFVGAAEVPVGSSATRRVTIRNTGNGAAELVAITPSDPRFTAALVGGGSLPLVLGPDAAAEVDVTFTPTANARTQDTIAFDVAAGNDLALTVIGDGVGLEKSLAPAASGSGEIAPGAELAAASAAADEADARSGGGCATGAPARGLPLGAILLLVLRRRPRRRAR